MKNIYFVTYRFCDYRSSLLKNAVPGDNEESHDLWVKTDHYDSEEKMIEKVFDLMINGELLDMIESDIDTYIEYGGRKYEQENDRVFAEKQNKKALILKQEIDELFPASIESKSFLNHCKKMKLENKKKFISFVEKNLTKHCIGIAYGVVKVK